MSDDLQECVKLMIKTRDDKITTLRAERDALAERVEKLENPDIEALAAAVHRAYCENYEARKGEPYWTGGDYERLDDETKEIDRATVRAILAALTQEQPSKPACEDCGNPEDTCTCEAITGREFIPRCERCGGSGSVESTTSCDGVEPPSEYPDFSACPECNGTGKETKEED